jgi:MSHA biogenesis protein MshK
MRSALLPGSWHRVATVAVVPFLFLATSACAQGLQDPMRPPSVAAVRAGELVSAVKAAPPASGLQLVKASMARREATIDGHVVKVGEKHGEATLVDVSDSSAVLRGPDGERITLRMFPDVEKRRAGPEPAKR